MREGARPGDCLRAASLTHERPRCTDAPWFPPDFDVPDRLDGPGFSSQNALGRRRGAQDFEAVIASTDRLRGLFGPGSAWPDGVTMAEDLIDLAWHQREFSIRHSFAYTVMASDDSRCLGCVYIFPSDRRGYDATVFYWSRRSPTRRREMRVRRAGSRVAGDAVAVRDGRLSRARHPLGRLGERCLLRQWVRAAMLARPAAPVQDRSDLETAGPGMRMSTGGRPGGHMDHDSVKLYYGKVLKSSDDLKTSACCTADSMPAHLKPPAAKIHAEVRRSITGAGSSTRPR